MDSIETSNLPSIIPQYLENSKKYMHRLENKITALESSIRVAHETVGRITFYSMLGLSLVLVCSLLVVVLVYFYFCSEKSNRPVDLNHESF